MAFPFSSCVKFVKSVAGHLDLVKETQLEERPRQHHTTFSSYGSKWQSSVPNEPLIPFVNSCVNVLFTGFSLEKEDWDDNFTTWSIKISSTLSCAVSARVTTAYVWERVAATRPGCGEIGGSGLIIKCMLIYGCAPFRHMSCKCIDITPLGIFS